MESVGDDRVTDPQTHPDEAEQEPGGRFDPGVETGYLKRTPREYALSPEIGAAPFDPGPGTGYDDRRAAKAAKRKQREERHALSERRSQAQMARLEQRLQEKERAAAGQASLEATLQSLTVPEPDHAEPAPDQQSRGLFWPTAKAGLAVTFVLALTAGLGSAIGLPVPGLETGTGHGSLATSASLFGVDQGTPQGLSAGYVFPLEGPHDFGDNLARFGAPRSGHVHEGQDIFGKTGTPEVAVHDGVVVDRGKNTDPDDGGRGNYVAIYSPADNHSFVYMHMLKPSPALLGHQVHAGQVIGQLGCTGSCDGPHLHFEVRIGKASLGADTKAVDPLPYLRQWPQPTPG